MFFWTDENFASCLFFCFLRIADLPSTGSPPPTFLSGVSSRLADGQCAASTGNYIDDDRKRLTLTPLGAQCAVGLKARIEKVVDTHGINIVENEDKGQMNKEKQ